MQEVREPKNLEKKASVKKYPTWTQTVLKLQSHTRF